MAASDLRWRLIDQDGSEFMLSAQSVANARIALIDGAGYTTPVFEVCGPVVVLSHHVLSVRGRFGLQQPLVLSVTQRPPAALLPPQPHQQPPPPQPAAPEASFQLSPDLILRILGWTSLLGLLFYVFYGEPEKADINDKRSRIQLNVGSRVQLYYTWTPWVPKPIRWFWPKRFD